MGEPRSAGGAPDGELGPNEVHVGLANAAFVYTERAVRLPRAVHLAEKQPGDVVEATWRPSMSSWLLRTPCFSWTATCDARRARGRKPSLNKDRTLRGWQKEGILPKFTCALYWRLRAEENSKQLSDASRPEVLPDVTKPGSADSTHPTRAQPASTAIPSC